MTALEAQQYVDTLEWVYAKSYSKTFPHYYTTRNRTQDEVKFEEFLRYMRGNSILKHFYSKQYLYLELNGIEYWEMGRPIKAVQVINRCRINNSSKFRTRIPTIEEQELLKGKLNLRDNYVDELINKSIRTDEEERHLKFLLNNERRIHGGGKNIMDHSSLEIKYK